MKKRLILMTCGVILALTGCGPEKDTASGLEKEPITVAENVQQAAQGENAPAEQSEGNATEAVITQEQALEAVKNYCIANNPDLEGMLGSEDYTTYFDVSNSEAGEIVVLFRSYTGAQIRYYVDPNTGDTYTTELVPGIIDEEQRTEETFNIRDYMNKPADSAGASGENQDAVSRADGERFEGTIWLEGMEEPVQYEHVVNEALGFEMDYEYELFARESSAEAERFINVFDNVQIPEDYLEVVYRAENADTVTAAISDELKKEYEISVDSFDLDHVDSCTRIDASACVGGQYMPEYLQTVYIIPDGEGTVVGRVHCSIESAEGCGRRFMYMMNTIKLLDKGV